MCCHRSWKIPASAMENNYKASLRGSMPTSVVGDVVRLTFSGNETLEVDGDGYPHGLAVVLGPEAPHADGHGVGPRLGRQAREEERLLGEVIQLPALALVCGESGDETQKKEHLKSKNTPPLTI